MGRRAAKGSFELVPGRQMATPQLVFKANSMAPETTLSVTLDADSALVTGSYTAAAMTGDVSGFRLASLGGSPPTVRKLTLALDAGVQNGVDYPAGFGWAKGTVSNRGAVLLKGQLGDAQSVTMTAQLGVTGQALVWVQPYRNKTASYFGGVLAMPNVGQPPATVDALPLGAWWFKAADSRELSYDAGFAAPLAVSSVTSAFTPVKTALELETALGLSGSLFHVEIEGGGLSNALGSNPTLPTAFTLGSNFALTTSAPTSPAPVIWAGKAVKTDGGLVGTLTLTPGTENLAGKAATAGVLLPGQGTAPGATVGAGLIKVPVTGKRGAFRTSSLLFEN
jgi:hypothetical protein